MDTEPLPGSAIGGTCDGREIHHTPYLRATSPKTTLQYPATWSRLLDDVPVLFYTVLMAMGSPFDLPYSVELWDDADSHVEELIALTGDYRVARAAFDEAVKCRPGRIVTLRQKTRLLADSRREAR